MIDFAAKSYIAPKVKLNVMVLLEEVITKTIITNSDVCRTTKVHQGTQVDDNDNSLNKEAKGAVNPRCRVRAERLPGVSSPHFYTV